jgi:hypothetical protein
MRKATRKRPIQRATRATGAKVEIKKALALCAALVRWAIAASKGSGYEQERRKLAGFTVVAEEAGVEGGDNQRSEHKRGDQEPCQKPSLRLVPSQSSHDQDRRGEANREDDQGDQPPDCGAAPFRARAGDQHRGRDPKLKVASIIRMWLMAEDMEKFRSLSFDDKWRLRGFVFRGEAPDDPRLAPAAVELAEGYQRQDRRLRGIGRWFPAVMGVAFLFLALVGAIRGEVVSTFLYALIALGHLAQYAFNPPATRPRHVSRALSASRQVAAATDC